MIFILASELTALALLCLYTRSKIIVPVEGTCAKGKITCCIFNVALFLAEKLIIGKFISYERKLGVKLSELNKSKDIKNQILMHIAKRIIMVAAALIAVTILGTLMDKPDISYALFAALVLTAAFFSTERDLNEKIKKRNFYIQYDFPDFINKMILLINAGMTVPRAWEKIVCDRETMTPLYEELNTTYLEMRNGKPELSAYEDFARRCRGKDITKFISLIIQNLRKGNSELVPLLRLLSNECWQQRKNMARRLGEEASTKLVLPLMIMFVGILIVVILPALLQLKTL